MSENQTESPNDPTPPQAPVENQQPTTAQVEEQAAQEDNDVAGTPVPSDEAKRVAEEDARKRLENPNEPVVREAREGVAGESTEYLKNVND